MGPWYGVDTQIISEGLSRQICVRIKYPARRNNVVFKTMILVDYTKAHMAAKRDAFADRTRVARLISRIDQQRCPSSPAEFIGRARISARSGTAQIKLAAFIAIVVRVSRQAG
jgi:hypothetical protein